MGNKIVFFDTTFINLKTLENGNVEILCNPPYDETKLVIQRSNPKFVELYNSLKCITAYTFKIDTFGLYNYLLDISEPIVHILNGVVINFLNVNKEFLPNYKFKEQMYEIVFKNMYNIRILVNAEQKDLFALGNKYKICYVKYVIPELYMCQNFVQDQEVYQVSSIDYKYVSDLMYRL